jgi:hypothetical protein
VLEVDAASASDGEGTPAAPFAKIGDALRLARCAFAALGEPGRVHVAAGLYRVSHDAEALQGDASLDAAPLVIDFPVHLFGDTALVKDADGVPPLDLGPYLDPTSSTVVEPSRGLASGEEVLVYVVDTDDVRIEGLVFRSGHCRSPEQCPGEEVVTTAGGRALSVVRATGVELVSNVFFPGFETATDIIASDALVAESLASDASGCMVCVLDQGRYRVLRNRLDRGGIFISGTGGNAKVSLGAQADAFDIPPITVGYEPRVDALVQGNAISVALTNAASFGVRVVAVGPSAAGKSGHVSVVARVLGNTIAGPDDSDGASLGVVVDAGFPARGAVPLSATLYLDVADNVLRTSGKPMAVLTSRLQSVMLGLVNQWAGNTILDAGALIVDSDLAYPDDFWVDHFAADPLSGLVTSGGACADAFACSTASYRGVGLPGVCKMPEGVCACPTAMVADELGVCHDPTPPTTTVVINGTAVLPGTTLP